MKALSVSPEWAMPIWTWDKQIECRSWKTDYRGKILICSTSKKKSRCISGHALCVVELLDVVPFTEEHLDLALMDTVPEDSYAWIFGGGEGTGWVEPFPVKGKLRLFDVDDELIKVFPPGQNGLETVEKYFEPLIYFRDDSEKKFWDDYIKIGWMENPDDEDDYED